MVLEKLLPDAFTTVLGWLARGELRSRMTRLEAAAGRPTTQPATPDDAGSPQEEQSLAPDRDESEPVAFEDELIRWAKLPPGLDTVDLAPTSTWRQRSPASNSSTPGCPTGCATSRPTCCPRCALTNAV